MQDEAGAAALRFDPLDNIDPDCVPVVARLVAGRERRLSGVFSPAQMRERVNEIFRIWNAGAPELARVETFPLPGAAGPRMVRRYSPSLTTGPTACLFYMHGGGWIIGDLDSEERYLRELALASGIQVFSLDYALAPEHKFPLPIADCMALVRAALERAAELHIDPRHIALGGSSAGANLAVAAAMGLRDSAVAMQALLLNCGAFIALPGPVAPPASNDPGPTQADMDVFLSLYLPDMALRTDPRVNVASADLRGLPRAKLIAGGADHLRADSIALARRLSDCGVGCELSLYPGLIHGFMTMVSEVRAARRAIDEAAIFLRTMLGSATG